MNFAHKSMILKIHHFIQPMHSELGGTKLIAKILPNPAMQSKLVFLITNYTNDEIA